MLEHALKVVEAARKLRLERESNVTRSTLDARELAAAIAELYDSLVEFDRETGMNMGGLEHKPRFPEPDEELAAEGPSAGALAELAEELAADEEQAPPEHGKFPGKRPSPSPADTHANAEGVADTLFNDGEEAADDLVLAIHTINQKLAYAVSKVGWNPRLSALAHAARIAQNNLDVDVDGPRGWVRIPAETYGALSLAIAEAALDQDVSVAMPDWTPKLKKEPPAPRPPASWFKK